MSQYKKDLLKTFNDLEMLKRGSTICGIEANNGLITYFYENGATKVISKDGKITETQPTNETYNLLYSKYGNPDPLIEKFKRKFKKLFRRDDNVN